MWRAMLFLLLCACTQARPTVRATVRAEHFDLGGARATVRDYAGDSICEAEPRFLPDELSSVNGLLKRFLDHVPGEEASSWTEAAIALAEDGGARLPGLLDRHDRSLSSLGRCEFARAGAWPPLIARGRDLITQTRDRLEVLPEALRKFRAEQALAAWQKERLEQQETARAACPQRLGSTIVYFAWRERGRTTWLFCDGAQLTRDGAQKPVLEPVPPELLRGKRPRDSVYFSAAGRYPTAAVMVAPGEEEVSAW